MLLFHHMENLNKVDDILYENEIFLTTWIFVIMNELHANYD